MTNFTVTCSSWLNRIALRKAKIVCNFGLSECSRVNWNRFRAPLYDHGATFCLREMWWNFPTLFRGIIFQQTVRHEFAYILISLVMEMGVVEVRWWCWVTFRQPTVLDRSRTGAFCAFSTCWWGFLDIFFSFLAFLFSCPLSLGDDCT